MACPRPEVPPRAAHSGRGTGWAVSGNGSAAAGWDDTIPYHHGLSLMQGDAGEPIRPPAGPKADLFRLSRDPATMDWIARGPTT